MSSSLSLGSRGCHRGAIGGALSLSLAPSALETRINLAAYGRRPLAPHPVLARTIPHPFPFQKLKMVPFVRAVISLTILLLLLPKLSLGMDKTLQEKVKQAYMDWFPDTRSVNYQDGRYNDRLPQYIRDHIQTMRVIEIEGSATHRHFIAPLHMRGVIDHFGMKYDSRKNHFVAFRMLREQLQPNVAVFAGIGEINGPKRVDVIKAFGTRILLYTPDIYQISFHVP